MGFGEGRQVCVSSISVCGGEFDYRPKTTNKYTLKSITKYIKNVQIVADPQLSQWALWRKRCQSRQYQIEWGARK